MPYLNPKIFKEYDIRGQYPWEIDEEAAAVLARAFIQFTKAKKVVIARDARIESAKIADAFIDGLVNFGVEVFDLSLDSTPSLFFSVSFGRFDAGVMVTASHNPDGYTGLKFCGKDGVAFGLNTGLEKIQALAEKSKNPSLKRFKRKSVKRPDFLPQYYKFIHSFISEKKIRPMKLVLDASNGAAAKTVGHVFVRLPGRVIKMNFKKGDIYPDHDLNPILPANHRSICREVKKHQADLGLIWDGDGDRCIFIDERGAFIQPYYLNCLLAQIILAKYKKIKFLIDARLPVGISEVIKTNGGRPIIHRSGYSNIIKTMTAEKILFGCENSGHYFFNFSAAKGQKRNFVYNDGIIPALLILEYLSENKISLAKALKPFKEKFFISGEINLKAKNFGELRAKIKKIYANQQSAEIDGLSIYGKNWFFNIRASQTEPSLVRVNIEAKSQEALGKVKREVMGLIK